MELWDLTVRFFSMADANVRYVIFGSMLLGGAAGGLGTFAFLQRRSLVGDTVAHAALPGVAIAFLLTGEKNLLIILSGALFTSWVGVVLVNYIISRSKLKLDTALGIVLSVFFGIGIVLLSIIQKSGSGSQSGLDKFLFGQAAAISKNDVILLAIVGTALLAIMASLYPKFKIIVFDPLFASASGLKTNFLQFLLSTLIVISVIIGLQAVGVVLMAALLFTPAAAARQWTDNLSKMIVLASIFGAASGILGAYISFLAPKFPTGPWIVIVVSFIFVTSILFAPNRGLVSKMRLHLNNQRKTNREHILKALYKSGQNLNDWSKTYSISEIAKFWSFADSKLRYGIRQLTRQRMMESIDGKYKLTDIGISEGARVLRLHRLWELYLSKYLELPEDHLHRDAEDMEHIITPEIEARLVKLLDNPQYDPHNQEIPYTDGKVKS